MNAREVISRFLLLVVSLSVAIGALEVALRLAGVNEKERTEWIDSRTHLEAWRPGITFTTNMGFKRRPGCNIPNQVRINSQGFHDDEFKLVKDPNIFRIAFLGDSMIEGKHVPIQEGVQFRLEQLLNQLPDRTKRYEIYSFSKGGTGMFEYYLKLHQYALAYKPDFVIVSFLASNDPGEDLAWSNEEMFDEEGVVRVAAQAPAEAQTLMTPVRRLARKSVFVRWTYYRVSNLLLALRAREEQKHLTNPIDQLPFDFQVFAQEETPTWQNIWQRERAITRAFRDTLAQRNIPWVLVSAAEVWRTNPESWQKDPRYYAPASHVQLNLRKPEEKLEQITREEGISYLNPLEQVLARVQQDNKSPSFWPCDPHWNVYGHQLMAESIFDWLVAHRELIEYNPK